jgi:nucleoid-associated protein YgaU
MKRVVTIVASVVILFIGWKVFTSGSGDVSIERANQPKVITQKDENEAQVKKQLQDGLLKAYEEPTLAIGGEEEAMSKFERSLGAMADPEEQVAEEPKEQMKIGRTLATMADPETPKEEPAPAPAQPAEPTMADVAAKPTNAFENALVAEADVDKPVAPKPEPKPAQPSMADVAAKPTNAFENALVAEAGLDRPTAQQQEAKPRSGLQSGALQGLLSGTAASEEKKTETTDSENLPSINLKGKKLRDRLKSLLAEAESTIENNQAMMPQGDTRSSNAVTVKQKSAKEMLYDLVNMAMESGTETDTRYVASLLEDVSKEKISVVEVTKEFTMIEVKVGDTLWKMAQNFYGDGFKYRIIHNANKDVITNASLISPGMRLKIPKAQ